MKISIKWLKDYVDFNMEPKELGDRLTLSGSKMETVEVTGDEIDKVVTGKIIKIEKHPDAEKLSICSVDINEIEPIQIVTAATNMEENDVIPVALHGSTISGGRKIKKGKLRGVVSNGMFCSEEELGLAEEGTCHGLMILDRDTRLGANIKEIVEMGKAVLDFEITSNRPDCLSVIGMARETAATIRSEYRMPKLSFTEAKGENINDILKVSVKDNLCKRYMARGVKNIKIGESPNWIKERLEESGVRAINNVVDITNFVMLELGQPMHAFDLRDIDGGEIIVERAKDGEKFTTLDEAHRVLNKDILTIRDKKGPIAIAGIMGGINSEVKEDTKTIIFESANFEGVNVRTSSKNLGLRSESSSRFEKEIDPNLAELALSRALSLIEELGIGDIMEGVIDIYNEKKLPTTMKVSSTWVNNFLGTDISKIEMKRCLDTLDLKTEIEGDTLVIMVPTFRVDISIKEDIAEEIVRIYGYNKVESKKIKASSIKSGKSEKQIRDDKVVDTMIASGLSQSISYSFFGAKDLNKINIPEDSNLRKTVVIKNPLGEDYSFMRTTTISSMMENLGRNYSRNNQEVRLFEMGSIYIPDENENNLPSEKNILTIGLYGNVDYFNLKGIVENLLEVFGINKGNFIREKENLTFHPGKTAKLILGRDEVGILGEIHPDVCENYKLDTRGYIAEINLDSLYKFAKEERIYKALPKFPAVSRDLAILVDENILVQEIDDIIKKQGGNIIEKVTLFDVYKGSQIEEGKKSVAYSILYRLKDKTLTDEEVTKTHNKILKTLEHKLGAELR